LKQEEEQFVRTLDRGLSLLEEELARLGDVREIPGNVVFKLYDTYGFPADLTADVVRDRGYTIDEAAFQQEMEKQRERAKEASNFAVDYNKQLKIEQSSDFCGYEQTVGNSAITAIYLADESVATLKTGEQALIVLDHTPFYAESGGQMGDAGLLRAGDALFAVTDTQKIGQAIVHKGFVEQGSFAVGATCRSRSGCEAP